MITTPTTPSRVALRLASVLSIAFSVFQASSVTALSPVYNVLKEARLVNAATGEVEPLGLGNDGGDKTLVVVLPQLGEFDSSEFCEHLVAALPALDEAGIDLRVVGIGNEKCARRFAAHVDLPVDRLWVDPAADLHDRLGTHRGPNLDVPDFLSDETLRFVLSTLPGGAPEDGTLLRPTARAWLNYLAMCAGVGAKGTLQEILRGYFGDASAPERLRPDTVVKVGDAIEIGPGVGPVRAGPFEYVQWFADERGYQRPVELATVRLEHMVEVLSNWDEYVSNPTTLDRRGGTWLFDNNDNNNKVLYEHRHEGVLVYSETMPRPLTFLRPYVGDAVASNPLGLPDFDENDTRRRAGRGVLKPAGKFMSLLKPVFSLENRLQARLTGVEEEDLEAARVEIRDVVASRRVVVFTYGLSPFSLEAKELLRRAGCDDFEEVEIGPEWFLLGRKGSALRAELLAATGQSSLPHVFVRGEHVGGLFTGVKGKSKGLANLYETGELESMLRGNDDEDSNSSSSSTIATTAKTTPTTT